MAIPFTPYFSRFSSLIVILLVLLHHAVASPMDPHTAQCSAGWLVPEKSFFEGWFTSMVDPLHGRRIHVIIITTPCSNQSYVGVLSCLPHVGRTGCVTQASLALTQDFHLSINGNQPVTSDPDYGEAPCFEWSSPQHGSYRVEGNVTHIHLHVGTVVLRATLTQQGGWSSSNGVWGPEGWPWGQFPSHYFVHSMGSSVKYHFTDASDEAYWMGVFGTGWAEEAKSWGSALPSAHAYGQATSNITSTKVVFALAYFNMSLVSLPYLAFIAFRSKKLSIDFRSTDVGTLFSNISAHPCLATMQLTGSTYSYELTVKARAPVWCFGPPLLGPVVGSNWTTTCSQCLGAEVELELAEHTAWGVIGVRRVLESHVLRYGSLSFGGDLLCSNSDPERGDNNTFSL